MYSETECDEEVAMIRSKNLIMKEFKADSGIKDRITG